MPPRTPRKAATKRTPYKPRTEKSAPEKTLSAKENAAPNESILDLVKYYKEKDKIRDDYIRALKEENAYLRAVGDSSSGEYNKFLGLSIRKENGRVLCRQAIEKDNRESFISFSLFHEDNMYTYAFEDSNIEELPEYLKKEIYFEEDQVKLFFFNVYECIVHTL